MNKLPTAEIRHTVWSGNVYEPSDDSFLLVDSLLEHAKLWASVPGSIPRTVVEIGSGSGYVICSVACILKALGHTSNVQLLAVDINPEACVATIGTLNNHQVRHVEVLQMDLLEALRQRMFGHIDLLIFNPPYVPTPDEEVAQEGLAKAWAGGFRGRRVIDRVLQQLSDMLSSSGMCFMVTVAENDPEGIIQEMQAHGFRGTRVLTRQADEEVLSIVRLTRTSAGIIAEIKG